MFSRIGNQGINLISTLFNNKTTSVAMNDDNTLPQPYYLIYLNWMTLASSLLPYTSPAKAKPEAIRT